MRASTLAPDVEQAASRFVAARRGGVGFATFPGALPPTLSEAYAIQDAAIDRYDEPIVGWKVGRIAAAQSARLGADRFVGPIFARSVQHAPAGSGEQIFPVITGGFAAFEAELLVRLDLDGAAPTPQWTSATARSAIAAIHIGVEVAGSPLATINDLGPLATTAGFGNNLGLIVGPAIDPWRALDMGAVACRTVIDGVEIAAGVAANLPGGPLTALAFALNQAAAIGRPLVSGQWVATGAITGVHPVTIGQSCLADFGPLGVVACRTATAGPQ